MPISEDDAIVICQEAERAARRYIFKRLSKRDVADLEVVIEVVKLEPLILDVDVRVELQPDVEGVDVNALVEGAANETVKAAQKMLRALRERSKSGETS